MSLIDDPRCFRCGSGLPLRVLWKFARHIEPQVSPGLGLLTRTGLLRGNVGVVCPCCSARFRVVQTRIRVVRVLLWSLLFAGAWLLGEWKRDAQVEIAPMLEIIGLVVALGEMVALQRLLTPRLAQIRLAADDEALIFPLRSADEPLPHARSELLRDAAETSNTSLERTRER